MATNFYQTLGVERTASDKEIKGAYRKLARQYHPDVNKGDAEAEKRFKEINEAYSVLSDKEKREKYDKYGQYWNQAGEGPGPGPGGPRGQRVQFNMDDLNSMFGGAGGAGGGMGDLFEMFSRGGGRGQQRGGFDMGDLLGGAGRMQQPEQPSEVEATVDLTLEDAFNGTDRGVQLQREDVCPRCQGSGHSGRSLCIDCRGSGVLVTPRRLEVKIPKGVREGTKIRVKGEGGTGPGGRPRDLFLVAHLVPHRLFELKGADLTVEVPVTVTEAVLGAEIQVPRVKGSPATIKIPAGTQSGMKFRLSGQGLPAFGNNPAGDLYAQIQIQAPKNLSDEERQLYERLAQLRTDNPRASMIGGG